MLLGREPAAIAAVVSIAINLAITFGLHLSIEQVALINALVVAVLALVVRQNVTPVASPMLPLGTQVLTPEGQAPGVVAAASDASGGTP